LGSESARSARILRAGEAASLPPVHREGETSREVKPVGGSEAGSL